MIFIIIQTIDLELKLQRKCRLPDEYKVVYKEIIVSPNNNKKFYFNMSAVTLKSITIKEIEISRAELIRSVRSVNIESDSTETSPSDDQSTELNFFPTWIIILISVTAAIIVCALCTTLCFIYCRGSGN